MTNHLPRFLQELIDRPPHAGEGVHDWLFRVARNLHAHLPATEIVTLLLNKAQGCGRNVSRKEVEDAVKNSIPHAWQPTGKAPPAYHVAKWPSPNLERVEAIAHDGGGLAELWDISPGRIEDSRRHTEEVIDKLFPNNSLLCCGLSQSMFDTRPREAWQGWLTKQQFIVPSPMSAMTGKTTDGHQSAHSLANTGPRRFLIIECDFSIYARDGEKETSFAPLIRRMEREKKTVADMCAAILLHLAQYAPLVCVVHSGGKSLHGWFFVEGQPDAKVEKFFRYAVSLGADRATWTRSQFVRMPDGTRENGNRQTIYFLNFKPLEAKP